MVWALGAVPPGPAAMLSMWRTANAWRASITRTPCTGSVRLSKLTGMRSPSRANTV